MRGTMPFQWLKKKVKGFEDRKENSKVNVRLQKLIADIKSKRDTFASVQTGFPSSVASFVTNTWMPSHDGDDLPVKKKKKRWPYTKKKAESFKDSGLNKGESLPRDEVCDPSLRSESVGQLEATPQHVDEISEQTSNDPQIVGQFEIYPDVVGHFGNNPQILRHFGNDPENLGHFDNDSHSRGQFGNNSRPTEIAGQDQVVKDVTSLEQLETCDPFRRGHARLCPMCRELLAVLVLLAVSISVVLDAKMAAVGVTVIVYFLLRVLFGNQESLSRNTILSMFSCVWEEFKSLCRAAIGKQSFSKCMNGLRSEGLPSKEASNCFVLPSFFERIKGVLLIADVNNQRKRRNALVQNTGIYMPVAKGRKLSSSLTSSLWIVVLVGLIAGRFTAFILALAWCLLVKFVEIAEHRQQPTQSFSTRGRCGSAWLKRVVGFVLPRGFLFVVKNVRKA